MQKFWNYLENEPIGVKKILSFFIFWLFIYVAYVSILMLVYPQPSIDLDVVKADPRLQGITFTELAPGQDCDKNSKDCINAMQVSNESKIQSIWYFAIENILDASIEEVVFRFAPFFLLFILYSKIKFSQKLFRIFTIITIIVAVFIYSVLSHGSFLRSFSSAELLAFSRALFVQGVGGLMLSIVYLKTGGIKGKIVKPLLLSCLLHWSCNVCLSTVSVIFFL